MAEDGFIHLSHAPARIGIECAACYGRRGDYSRERAIQQYGDLTMPDFLWTTVRAHCSRAGAINGPRCEAGFTKETMDGCSRH